MLVYRRVSRFGMFVEMAKNRLESTAFPRKKMRGRKIDAQQIIEKQQLELEHTASICIIYICNLH